MNEYHLLEFHLVESTKDLFAHVQTKDKLIQLKGIFSVYTLCSVSMIFSLMKLNTEQFRRHDNW